MLLLTPDHKPAAEPHHLILDVDHPGLAPGFEKAVWRPAAVERLDVRAEEATGPPPGIAPEHEARAGHRRAGVEAPAHPPERIRGHVEVEAGHATRRAEHAGQLAQRRRWIGHVTQQVRERDGVERRCRKRKLLGARALQPDPAVQAGGLNTFPACFEHRLADVDTADLTASRPD